MNKIKLNGKSYGFKFSYKAIKNFMHERGKTFETMDTLSIEDIAYVGYYGLLSAGEEVTFEQVEEMLDNDFSGIRVITAAMQKDMESFMKDDVEPKKKKAA